MAHLKKKKKLITKKNIFSNLFNKKAAQDGLKKVIKTSSYFSFSWPSKLV